MATVLCDAAPHMNSTNEQMTVQEEKGKLIFMLCPFCAGTFDRCELPELWHRTWALPFIFEWIQGQHRTCTQCIPRGSTVQKRHIISISNRSLNPNQFSPFDTEYLVIYTRTWTCRRKLEQSMANWTTVGWCCPNWFWCWNVVLSKSTMRHRCVAYAKVDCLGSVWWQWPHWPQHFCSRYWYALIRTHGFIWRDDENLSINRKRNRSCIRPAQRCRRR